MKTNRWIAMGGVVGLVALSAACAVPTEAGAGDETTGTSAAAQSVSDPGPHLPVKTCTVTPAAGPPADTNVDDPSIRMTVVRGMIELGVDSALAAASKQAGVTIGWASDADRPTKCGDSCMVPFGRVQTQQCAPATNDAFVEYATLFHFTASKAGVTVDIYIDPYVDFTCTGWRTGQGIPGMNITSSIPFGGTSSVFAPLFDFFSDGAFDAYLQSTIASAMPSTPGYGFTGFPFPSKCSSIGLIDSPSAPGSDLVVWGD